MATTYQFPKDFLWGTATSAFQIEGNNKNTDWWEWENDPKKTSNYPEEKSGIGCDSYNRYEEDFDLCKNLNSSAVRISIEWARIQPSEGIFDEKEVEHYKKVLKAAKDRGMETFVTLLHFTIPIWIAKKGGWQSAKTARFFEKYAKYCAQEFGTLIDKYITINEPLVYTSMAYINGTWPPNKENLITALYVQNNLVKAHRWAYKAIKSVGAYHQVGIVKNIVWYEYTPSIFSSIDWLVTGLLRFMNMDLNLNAICRDTDFIGLNYYFTVRLKGLRMNNLDDIKSDLGWWVNPKGLENVLLHLKKWKLPIYVTENGVADKTDRIRKDFIRDMLIACHNAMEKGVDLRGYFYWSLIDNYEWHHGYWPKFGLVYIDRENNLARVPRKSFNYYADICRSGRLKNGKILK